MKKLLLAFCATAALFTLKAEDDILLETVFSDPTSFHTPAVAKNVTTFKNVKVYHIVAQIIKIAIAKSICLSPLM